MCVYTYVYIYTCIYSHIYISIYLYMPSDPALHLLAGLQGKGEADVGTQKAAGRSSLAVTEVHSSTLHLLPDSPSKAQC